MIFLEKNTYNQAVATASRNKQLSSPTYLWSMRHKLTNQTWRFIPYPVPSSVNYTPSYDLFLINIDTSLPQTYIYSGSSVVDAVNLHLIDGEYFVKVYEQISPSNLNPALSYDVVWEGTARVDSSDEPSQQIVSYTATTNTFKVYQG